MNPYKRGALMLIRLVAFGLILISAMNLGLYWFKLSRSHEELNKVAVAWHCFVWSLPFLFGLVIWIKSSAIANRLTQDFDD